MISLYLMLYSTVRFVVEFFRYHEQANPFGGPLDTGQWISAFRSVARGETLETQSP
jgi:prolipoprotein diacylglyceryltransferase